MFLKLKKNEPTEVRFEFEHMSVIPEDAKTIIFFTKYAYNKSVCDSIEKRLSEKTGKKCVVLPHSYTGCVISL